MHSGGYLDRNVNKTSSSRLAIVIALHGAAITALMLAPPEIVPKPDWKSLILVPIEETVPPPPEKLPPPQPAKADKVEAPKSVIDTTQATDNGSILTPTGGNNDIGIAPSPPLPTFIEPVIKGASFVSGAEIQPDYPVAMARQEIEGAVTVNVLIGTDGRVKDVQQISATDPEFFKATERQALRRWKFKPAIRDGIAIESWKQITVRFKLNG